MASNPLRHPSHYETAVDQAHAYLAGTAEYTPEATRWMVGGLMTMGPTEVAILAAFLLGNESRIAKSEDGLGILQVVFEAVNGREAKA